MQCRLLRLAVGELLLVQLKSLLVELVFDGLKLRLVGGGGGLQEEAQRNGRHLRAALRVQQRDRAVHEAEHLLRGERLGSALLAWRGVVHHRTQQPQRLEGERWEGMARARRAALLQPHARHLEQRRALVGVLRPQRQQHARHEALLLLEVFLVTMRHVCALLNQQRHEVKQALRLGACRDRVLSLEQRAHHFQAHGPARAHRENLGHCRVAAQLEQSENVVISVERRREQRHHRALQRGVVVRSRPFALPVARCGERRSRAR
mmetsp:Transcript_6332/g.18989  ORF Transcript_6332/g.18989 Transcript_6332/m.18989 type:complete len:263 (+) Transcript_6332:1323-2111(+)